MSDGISIEEFITNFCCLAKLMILISAVIALTRLLLEDRKFLKRERILFHRNNFTTLIIQQKRKEQA